MKTKNKKNSIFVKFNNDENFRNKTILSFIFLIGVVAIFLNIKSLKSLISDPLIDKDKESIKKLYETYDNLKAQGKITEDNTTSTPTSTDNTTNVIKNDGTDTDGDGISDYDEKNVFGTSMYLKDSDGDGINDSDEIKNGTDPNCATGKVCSGGAITTTIDNTSTNTTIDVNSLDISKVREELKKIAPESVRSMVDTMTDEQVRTIFSTLYEQSKTSTATTTSNKDYINTLKAKLPNFTPQQISMMNDMEDAEIKEILIESGVADEALLSQFKEGELKSTVLGE